MKNRLMSLVEERPLKRTPPKFEIGDTVEVHQRILEGQKERIQVFSGMVISPKRRRHARDVHGAAHRPGRRRGTAVPAALAEDRQDRGEAHRRSVRRAKLYYLRDRVGKATRLRERKAEGRSAAADGGQQTKRGRARSRMTESESPSKSAARRALTHRGTRQVGCRNLPRENHGGGAGSAPAPNAPPRASCAGSAIASWPATTSAPTASWTWSPGRPAASSSSRCARPAATTRNGRPCRWTPRKQRRLTELALALSSAASAARTIRPAFDVLAVTLAGRPARSRASSTTAEHSRRSAGSRCIHSTSASKCGPGTEGTRREIR